MALEAATMVPEAAMSLPEAATSVAETATPAAAPDDLPEEAPAPSTPTAVVAAGACNNRSIAWACAAWCRRGGAYPDMQQAHAAANACYGEPGRASGAGVHGER